MWYYAPIESGPKTDQPLIKSSIDLVCLRCRPSSQTIGLRPQVFFFLMKKRIDEYHSWVTDDGSGGDENGKSLQSDGSTE